MLPGDELSSEDEEDDLEEPQSASGHDDPVSVLRGTTVGSGAGHGLCGGHAGWQSGGRSHHKNAAGDLQQKDGAAAPRGARRAAANARDTAAALPHAQSVYHAQRGRGDPRVRADGADAAAHWTCDGP